MKASRLLHLLLLLQTRHRITTTELADRLEVSRRTVLRDVDALSMAGVPVYAERGRKGGIALIPGARINVSHLDPAELEALSMAGLDGEQLGLLGLAAEHDSAGRKIAARQASSSARPGSPRLADLVLVESTAWMEATSPTVDVAALATELRRRRQLRIRYRRSTENRASSLVVDPYGLVAKSGRWYLVADDQHEARLLSLDRLASYESLDRPATLRAGQSLRTVWAELKEQTESSRGVEIRVRLRANRLDLARRILGNRLGEVSDATASWCTAVVRYSDVESVRQLLQFGDHIEILAPARARERVQQLAEDLAERHSAGTAPRTRSVTPVASSP